MNDIQLYLILEQRKEQLCKECCRPSLCFNRGRDQKEIKELITEQKYRNTYIGDKWISIINEGFCPGRVGRK